MQQNINKTLPPISHTPILRLAINTSLKRISRHRQASTQRIGKGENDSSNQKVISHFLIRYLERKQHFQEKQVVKTGSVILQNKKTEQNLNTSFRRAMIKRRNSPRKPLQTRFLIANYESIAYV